MRVRMLRGFSGPELTYRPGQVVEMVNAEAIRLIALGVCLAHFDQPEPPPGPEPADEPPPKATRRRGKKG